MRRFEKKVYIPLLNGEGRKKLIEKFLGFNRYDSNSFDWDYLVANTQGYTGADILCLCRDAAMMSIRKHIQILEVGFDCPISENDTFVTMENMIEALNRVSKSISSEELEKYESWAHETS
jgi:SpoVK/Ycf46/Vps4 family AAA+-type ATPase